MRIGIITEVIQKVDIGSGEYGVCLEITTKRDNAILCIPFSRSDYLQEFLMLLGKESLSAVNDVPVRMLGTIEPGDDGSVSEEIEIVAVGDLLEDAWLVFADEDEVDIVDFEALIKELGLQDAEYVMMY